MPATIHVLEPRSRTEPPCDVDNCAELYLAGLAAHIGTDLEELSKHPEFLDRETANYILALALGLHMVVGR